MYIIIIDLVASLCVTFNPLLRMACAITDMLTVLLSHISESPINFLKPSNFKESLLENPLGSIL